MICAVSRAWILQELQILWSSRVRVAYAYATYNLHKKEMYIKIASKKWLTMTKAEQRATVFHEVAHILNDLWEEDEKKHWNCHGPQWVGVMATLGYPNATPET